MKKLILSLAALSMATTATAGEITIGVIDSGFIDARETAEYSIETVQNVDREIEAPFKHGEVIVDVVVDEWKKHSNDRLNIMYVSAFEADAEGEYKNDVILDYQTMYHGMVQMKKAGVTHICTAFSGSDAAGSVDFVNFANKLGMTVVASLGNDDNEASYPAMTDGAIGVIAKEYRHMNNRSAEWKASIDFTETGIVGDKRGTSYASARVCAQLAAKAAAPMFAAAQ